MASSADEGVFCPIVTPFDGATVDTEALSAHVKWLLDAGIDGIVACGTTGEFASLTNAERETVIRVVVEAVSSRVPVIAGTASTNVETAVSRIRRATDLGADSVLVPPPFFHGANNPRGIVQFFEQVCNETSADLLLYNIPACTGDKITPDVVCDLATRERIYGLKDSSGDFSYLLEVLGRTSEEFTVLVGPDALLVPGLAMGIDGGVNGLSNVIPRELRGLYDAALNGDYETVVTRQSSRIQPLLDRCHESGYVPTIKTALTHTGVLPRNDVRPPLVAPDTDRIQAIDRTVSDIGDGP